MSHDPLIITARMAGKLAGDAPRLDGLLEAQLSLFHAKAVPGYKITRNGPAPAQGEIPIPMRRERLGDWLVGRCSDAILPEPSAETVEHIAKRIGVEDAGLLHPQARVVVSTTNSWTKSYRLPLRIRLVDRVVWFAVADRRECLKLLRRVEAIGKKIADGYGRVGEWAIERIDADCSWFAPSDGGPVLMATLPVGPWLPKGLLGAREHFGAAAPPYWHPERYTEIVVPC
jgi:hypothetical protein